MPRKTAAGGDASSVHAVPSPATAAQPTEADLLTDDDTPSLDVLFPLRHTKPGKYARVRRLPLITLITLSAPSPTLESVVLEVFGNVQLDPETATPVSGGLLDQVKKNAALVNGVCVLGFRQPRLVETEEEAIAANDRRVLWVERIDPRDRQAYYDLVNDSESEAAKALAPFPAHGLEGSATDESLPPSPPPVDSDAAA